MTYTTDRKLILALALPAVLQTVIRSSFSLIDAYWVGKLGSIQLAGISVATFLVWGILSISEIISIGTNSIVAHSEGAKDREASRRISTTNLINSLFHSLIVGYAVIPVLPFLYTLVDLTPEQRIYTNDYLLTFVMGLPCVTLLTTASSIFRGYGDTKTPFYLLLLAVVLNFFLAPLFIFGISPSSPDSFLKMDLVGAALSTLVAYFASFLAAYYILRKKNYIHPVSKYIFDKLVIKETYKIGIPISLNGVAFSLIYVFVSRFVADYGTVGLAALGIGHRSESLAFQVCVGFSLAATIMVGQNLGASDPKKAERLAWKVLSLSMVVTGVYGILMYVFSAEIAAIFTSDIGVIEAASNYNRYAAAVMLFTAAEVIMAGAFSGAGDTVPPAIIGLPINLLRIPLCAVLSPKFGLDGIWMAIAISVVLKGGILMIWFKKGNWKKKKIKFKKEDEHNMMETVNTE
jgi:putative MATE family efflux protein